jgi:ribosomal protein S18 acetylase RimI-like enzyme
MPTKIWNVITLVALVVGLVVCLSQKPKAKPKAAKAPTDDSLLEKCFNKSTLQSFQKYRTLATIHRIPHAVVFTTPSQHVDGIPHLSWNGVFINNLCVDPTQRNAGIGTELVSVVLEEAKKAGKDHVILQVKRDNAAAVRMYEKLRFVQHFSGVNEDGDEVVVYVRYL